MEKMRISSLFHNILLPVIKTDQPSLRDKRLFEISRDNENLLYFATEQYLIKL